MAKYPEHEKLKKISTQSQAIGDFVDWLQDGGYNGERVNRMTWQTWEEEDTCPRMVDHTKTWVGGKRAPCTRCNGTGLVTVTREGWIHQSATIERLLAAFFEIDQKKIDDEKREMLDEIRAANARAG